MDSPPQKMQKKSEEGFGPLVGIIIIVAVLAAGGIYFLVMQEIGRQATPPAGQEQANSR